MLASSMKKGRFSSKNSSLAERFTLAGSTSTWPKSGFTVALSRMLLVSVYLRSPPILVSYSLSPRNGSPGATWRYSARPVTYGISSRLRVFGRDVRPVRSAHACGPPGRRFGVNASTLTSPFLPMSRRTWMPQVVSAAPTLYLSCEKGMRSSALQPSESIDAPDSHTASHELSWPPPASHAASRTAPAGVIRKTNPVSRSWYVSRYTSTRSTPNTGSSRRTRRALISDASESSIRKPR